MLPETMTLKSTSGMGMCCAVVNIGSVGAGALTLWTMTRLNSVTKRRNVGLRWRMPNWKKHAVCVRLLDISGKCATLIHGANVNDAKKLQTKKVEIV